MRTTRTLPLLLPLLLAAPTAYAATPALGDYASHAQDGRSWVVTTGDGQKLRVTPYGDKIVRIQGAPAGQAFTPDDRYAIVLKHDWPGQLTAQDAPAAVTLGGPSLQVVVSKSPLRVEVHAGQDKLVGESAIGGLLTGDRPLAVTVGGTAAGTIGLPITGSWARWTTSTVTLNLAAGANTLRFTTAGANGPNVDWVNVNNTTYEAEGGARSGATVANQYLGYTGAGYVDFQNATGDYFEVTVNVPAAGAYPVNVKYANGAVASEIFAPAADEHYFGLGYGAFGRVTALDLRGQSIGRNRVNQAPILAPFFVSSKGYGVFVNSTWQNNFDFTDASYGFMLSGGQIDYFVIAGPEVADVLEQYTQLTGRPRLPPVAAFGLGLSDKIGDTLPSNEQWWKDNVQKMRNGGWPFDLIIHDNCWRGGKTAAWQWDLTRYPDPKEFEQWCKDSGVANQLDFNRADDTLSAGWQSSYLMPGTVDFPDFSNPAVRAWFWQLLSSKSLDPNLGYPGDFLWLDEPDEDVTPTADLADGRQWGEDANYYFFLEAQAVGEGWESTFQGKKRPYVMSRGMTAGAQRWATVWSGDIDDTYDEMKVQIRGMLAAGLSGFPFWAHDAGGFHTMPSDAMYRQWSIAMGSFSPMWKPHGIGLRFPWLFSQQAQDEFKSYGALRMHLIPYLYTAAWRAATTGTPITRAMVFDWRTVPDAWKADQQYMWGDAFLVAPATSDGGNVNVWLPPGAWFDYWDETKLAGDKTLTYAAPTGKLPLFVKAGAIVFGAEPSLSTKAWDRTKRVLDVYAGADGAATQFEDDGISDAYQSGGRALTKMTYADADLRLTIAADDGTYAGAPATRSYHVSFHGLDAARELQLNGAPVDAKWDAQKHVLSLDTGPLPVNAQVVIEPRGSGVPGVDGGADDSGAGGPGATPGDGSGGSGSGSGCGCRTSRADGSTLLGVLIALGLLLRRDRKARS